MHRRRRREDARRRPGFSFIADVSACERLSTAAEINRTQEREVVQLCALRKRERERKSEESVFEYRQRGK
jgi:hypothetical protein